MEISAISSFTEIKKKQFVNLPGSLKMSEKCALYNFIKIICIFEIY